LCARLRWEKRSYAGFTGTISPVSNRSHTMFKNPVYSAMSVVPKTDNSYR
jgi:hypothetical protein